MKKGFACGVFDMFHAGHVLMLQECKEHCDYLLVALNRAENISKAINPNKQAPLYTFDERKLILEACKYVDEVIPYNSEEELLRILATQNVHIRFLGDDYRNKPITGGDLPIELFYTNRSHGLSTSLYKQKLKTILEKHQK